MNRGIGTARSAASISPITPTASRARDLYPHWDEARRGARESVFRSVAKCAKPGVVVRTDENRNYPPIIDRLIPDTGTDQHRGTGNRDKPGSDGFDWMYKLNHLFDKMRQDL